MASGLILIADSDASYASAMTEHLRLHHHDVVAVVDGVAAIAELHGAEFDVAVIEVGLTGRSVFDVIAAAHHLSPDTEVIAVAREPQLGTALECIRHGTFDLLQKTVGGETLAASISRAIERRRLRGTTALYRASQEIFTSQDPEKLPGTIVAIAARLLEADDVALALPGRDGRMRTVHSHSMSPAMRERAHEEVGDDVAEAVAQLGDAVLLPEDAGWKVSATLVKVRSCIVFPMASGERHIGTLTVSRVADPRPYRRADVERASVLASQVLLAVENAALVRRTVDAERLATIGQLAAGVAHEINNPLTYVLASGGEAREQLELLRVSARALGPAAENERIATILQIADALTDVCDGGQRIAEIARDLRTLARGNIPSRETVDLDAAIRSAARVTASGVRQNAKLDLDLSGEGLVSGHAGRLTQVFGNLIVNAAQAGCERPLTIVVRTLRVGDRVIASVSDDGPGIRPEHLDVLFQPFFSTKSSSMGTGLGLSLTQSIVEEHSGTIQVASELGRGATFTLSFPAATEGAIADGPRSAARHTRLVFVDGEHAALRAYERWFGRDPDVVTLDSGADAVRLLADRAEVGAVICDLETGGLRGREIYDQVCRARPELATKFVFVSAGHVDGENEAFLASCARPLLAKPLDVALLQAALTSCADAA